MKFKGKANFKEGDLVHISKSKRLFDKSYLTNWSEQLFEVSKSLKSYPSKHFLKNLMGGKVTGGFDEQEMQKVDKPDSCWIEKVIKSRKRTGIKEYFVTWLGYPEKFNIWVTEKDGFLPLSSK